MNLYLRLIGLLARLRLRPRIGFFDTARLRTRVWPSDLDTVGHMNNAKYLALLDLSRVDHWFRSGLWTAVTDRDWYPVVGATSIRYRRSLKPGERFTVTSRVIGWDDRSLYHLNEFVLDDDSATVAARAVVQLRMLRKAGGHVTPAELLEVMDAVPGQQPHPDLELPDWVHRWATDIRHGL